ncbi:DUF4198 domain-containing protein [Psychromarinibacter sp. C21-152]|uniref:DUF4198 domain-containing protein n=1 Tax=Psychromarinibacter sediminicola TaxID=3033385 RepID=A0AAE3NSS1_9RHOB|nr:DUF4198 domain-containing protein [Psychromarinibacter sediminicola]MDF0603603.1 DUF4198 domain-containing protein [Psychromarinibacter sediminicola]
MRFLPVLLSALLAAAPLAAHEFWISPEDYTVETGGEIKAEIRVGQNFRGAGYPYIPKNFERFDLVTQDATVPVEGRIGDRPALSMSAPGEGLVTVVHRTRAYLLTYDDWATFEQFVTHKDFPWALARHLERGYSKDRVRERYIRFAKSLVAVGDGAGQDREVGLLTEIVALANPYTDALDEGLPVRVLFEGEPRRDVQVEVFAKAPDGDVTVETYRTDDAGEAVIGIEPGVEYLVDSVVMRELETGEAEGPKWESLWASLTFRVPE